MEYENFSELKIVAIKNKIKLSTELPQVLGYKTLWGVKCAIKTEKGKEKINKNIKFFLNKKSEIAKK